MARLNSEKLFVKFWDIYGQAIGGKYNVARAKIAWNRLTDADRHAAINGIAAYRDRCRQQGVAMMYAQGYLSCRRWEDDDVNDTNTDSELQGSKAESFDDMETW